MYTTDLSDTQWQFIKSSLNIEERKRQYDLREVWNGILYLVKTGCQWRMLPVNFPKWQLVYYYYSKWANLELFDLLLEKLREKVRIKRSQTLSNGQTTRDYWIMGVSAEKKFKHFSIFINAENFLDTRQSRYQPMYTGTIKNPVFSEIWAPTDGFIFNGGFKIML